MKYRGGFTIVELLIVVVVIAILATLTIVGYTGIQQRATTARFVATVDTIEKQLLTAAVEGKMQDVPALAMTCLGSPADFPETSEFPAGVCRVAGGVNFAVDAATMQFLNTVHPTAFKVGALPTVKISQDDRSRGITFYALGGSANQGELHWYTPDSTSCGRGYNNNLVIREMFQEVYSDAKAVTTGVQTLAWFEGKYGVTTVFGQTLEQFIVYYDSIGESSGSLANECSLTVNLGN